MWSQPAILSVPATDRRRVALAFMRGTDALPELLGRAGITSADVATRLGLSAGSVERVVEDARPAPAVMIDGEDAARGSLDDVAVAISDALRSPGRRADTLRFVRVPAGPDGERVMEAMAQEIGGAGAAAAPDSVVLPKVATANDVAAAIDALARFEQRLGLLSGDIRVHLLIETPAGVESVTELINRAGARLGGVLFGALDYAALAGLPDPTDHAGAALGWARARVANAAAAAACAAIDGMTTTFPPPARDPRAGAGLLSAIETTYRDTLRAVAQGFAGKLVGHPAQLLAALLAFREVYSGSAQQRWSDVIEAYETSRSTGLKGGAITVRGEMIDEASVRHARTMLMRARCAGFATSGQDPERATDPDRLVEARQ
jgi:citrate lyase subunit beta/citryl-CoA lyase